VRKATHAGEDARAPRSKRKGARPLRRQGSNRSVRAHELALSVDSLLAFGCNDPLISPVRKKQSGLYVVSQAHVENFFFQALFEPRIFNGGDQLDAPVEVALHPVGASDVDVSVAAVLEVVDAAVFKKATDDAPDFDLV